MTNTIQVNVKLWWVRGSDKQLRQVLPCTGHVHICIGSDTAMITAVIQVFAPVSQGGNRVYDVHFFVT